MPQSQVDLCNSALQKVGASRITSIDSDLPEARQCKIAYDSCRRSELSKHPWSFAIKRTQLAADSTAPSYDYDYQFTLPTDCVRVLFPSDAQSDWVIEGNKLLTNDSNVLQLRYIRDVEDVTRWSPAFYDAMASALAIDVCEKLTNAPGKRQTLLVEYRDLIAEARKANAFQATPVDGADDKFWTVRL